MKVNNLPKDVLQSLLFNHTMKINLKKFGTILTSRQAGKESLLAFRPTLNEAKETEEIEVDFEGVNSFSPSWGDEFLTPLYDTYGDRLFLTHTQENPSVVVTLDLLDKLEGKKFRTLS